MKMYVCSVFDKKVNAFMAPQCFRTRGEAMRAFMDAITGDSPMRRHAEDYVFYMLGEYDDGVGQFLNCVHGPEPLMTAMDVVSVENGVN